MSRHASIRPASLILAALLMGVGATATAADAPAQRVAMASIASHDLGAARTVARHAAPERTADVKTPTQRLKDGRQGSREGNDGSRFIYASCGCSND